MQRKRTGLLGAVVVAALAASTLTAAGGAVADGGTADGTSDKAPGAAKGTEGPRQVTLITGDRVTVQSDGSATGFRSAKGRADIPVSVKRVGKHTYVVPGDAVSLLRKGKLDRRLFDVRELVRTGYDDKARADLPLIVAYRGAGGEAKRELRASDAKVKRTLSSINADALSVRKSATPDVWEAVTAEQEGSGQRSAASGIDTVWLDGKRRASLDKSVPQIGAPEAWKAGYDGKGVKIAVLDTGVDQTHPDLNDREIGERNFSGAADNVDRFGHGTHVASIALGSGAKAGGKYQGVAPGAKVLDGKVLDDGGWGFDSGIIAGMQWAVEEGAKVVNLSLGGWDAPEIDPMEEAVNTLSEKNGTLFVIAAGNSGPGERSIGSPGSADAALTVGAVDKSDQLADFSSRGPTAAGALKPDLTGPGVDIVAAKAADGWIGDPVEDGYVSLSGTSMATPHVAGAAAILAQEHPDWSGARLKATLTSSVNGDAALSPFQQGTGRVDVAQAVKQTTVAEPGTVNFGMQRWPHDDDELVNKTLTYRNDGEKAVTLDLSASAFAPDGSVGPSGLFSVQPSTLTVPAGGTAEATVTADTRPGTLTGVFSGIVTATGDGQSVRTSMVVEREHEAYDLTLKHTGRNGKLTGSYSTLLAGLDVDYWGYPYEEDGSITLRLRAGRYTLDSTIQNTSGGEITGTDWLTQPVLHLTKDTTVGLDARKAKPVNITVPDRKADQRFGTVGYNGNYNGRWFGGSQWLENFRGLRTAHLGPKLSAEQLTAYLSGVWQRQDSGSKLTNYRVPFVRTGSMYTGFTHKTSVKELAKVSVGLGASVKNKTGMLTATPYVNDVWVGSIGFRQGLPGTSTEYLRAASGVRWGMDFQQLNAWQEPETSYSTTPRTYKADKSYSDRFNTAVFGPSLTPAESGAGIFRSGDSIRAWIPLFTDGKGHQGYSLHKTAKTVLYRDGKKIWQSDYLPFTDMIPVPAEKASYKLTTDVYRSSSVSGVSTRITGAWTFTSEHVAPDQQVQLPASAVRFSPSVTLSSSLKAGASAKVPFTVQGSGNGKGLKKVTVQVSYDGGKNWKSAKVVSGKYVTLKHPKKPGAVSLRAKVTDRQGGTLTQTIYRAYTTSK